MKTANAPGFLCASLELIAASGEVRIQVKVGKCQEV